MLYQRKVTQVEARQYDGPRLTVVHDELGDQTAYAGDFLIGTEPRKVEVMTKARFEREFEPAEQ